MQNDPRPVFDHRHVGADHPRGEGAPGGIGRGAGNVHLRLLVEAGAAQAFAAPVFNEFVAEFAADFRPTWDRLLEKGLVAGLELGGLYPELAGRYLFCVTETISKQDMDAIAAEVRS